MEIKTGYKKTEVATIPVDWEVKPLKVLTNLIIDGTHFTPKYKEFGVPFLRVTDVQNSEIDFNYLKFISPEEHRFLTRRCKPERGDLLLSKNGTIGIPKIVTWDWEFSIFVSLALIKPNSKLISVQFLEQFFKSEYLDEQIKKRSKQGTVTNLHLEEIREFLIPLPPTLAEQQAIAAALSDVDALLTSLDALIAKKRLIKQGAMQELLTGKKRLPGFGDEWEIVKFDDLADKNVKWSITGGPFGSNLKASDYVPDGVRIIQLQNIGDGVFHDDYAIYTSEQKANELISCNIYPGEIILSKMGDPVARACLVPMKAKRYLMASDGIRLVVDAKRFDKRFVFYYINSIYFRRKAIEASTGSTRQRIGLTDLRNLPFIAPSLPEQTAIAEILSDMDAEISALETRREKTRLLKAGMMQELLTGRIRLV